MRIVSIIIFSLICSNLWADCPNGSIGYYEDGSPAEPYPWDNEMHCAAHRCVNKHPNIISTKYNASFSACLCENLNGSASIPLSLFRDQAGFYPIKCNAMGSVTQFIGLWHFKEKAQEEREAEQRKAREAEQRKAREAEQSKAREAEQSKISIDDAKILCNDLGFKPKTENFGECVLELIK